MSDTLDTPLALSPAQTLLHTLNERIGACLADGTLVLPAQTIASSAVADLLAAFGGGARLDLAAARVVLGSDDLTISGQFAPLPDTALAAIARFYVADGRLQLELTARMAPGQTLGIRRLAQQFLPAVALPDELPDLGLVTMTLASAPLSASFSFGNGNGGWTVPLGPVGLAVGDVSLALTRSAGAEGEPARTLATLGGSLALGGADFTLAYTPPGALVVDGHTPSVALGALLADLCGDTVAANLHLPAMISGLQLPEAQATLDVAERRFSLAATGGVFDAVGVAVGRDAAGAWGFTAGFKPVAHWKLSDLDPALSVMDGLVLDELALVVSSAADGGLPLPAMLASRTDLEVQRGVNLMAALDLRGLGADRLLGLETLAVHAAIGTSLDSLLLEAEVGGHMKLSDTVEMGDLKFRLHPAPNNFEVSVLGQLGVTLSGSNLLFTGAMNVTPTGASFAATMGGDWNEPFGAQGVVISNLAVELGIAFDDGLPIVGLAGGMTLGSAHGKAAVRVDSGNPSLCMLAVDFDTLHLGEIITQLCDAAVHDLVPPEAAHTILNVNLNKALFALVPQRTHIGEIVYEQGIHVAADLDVWGFQAQGELLLDFNTGVLVDARIDPIVVGDAFRFTGAHGQGQPMLHLAVGPATPPGVKLSGQVMLLGASAEADIRLDDSGFAFEVDGKLLDLFEASLAARGGHFDGEDGFMLRADLKNDLFAVLREHATQAIADAAQQATSGIAAAQHDVDAAQAQVNGLDSQIAAARRTVQAERDIAQRRLADAQRAVADAKAKLITLDQQAAAARNTVQAERATAQQRLADAQRAVAGAQATVDNLAQQIANTRATVQAERAQSQRAIDAAIAKVNAAQSGVNSLQAQIDALNRWYYGLPRTDWPWKDSQATRAIDFAARQGALYTALGGAKAGLATAQGVLNLARQAAGGVPVDADPRLLALFSAKGTADAALRAAAGTLSLAQAAVAAAPVDADPRVAGPLAARAIAATALDAAQAELQLDQAAVAATPVDADPRVSGLIAGRALATAGLSAATGVLSAAKSASSGVLSAADFIARAGLGGVIDVRAAHFETSLALAKGGQVMLSAEVDYLGRPQLVQWRFSFHDPVAGAKALAQQLMAA